jgi:bifunctional non-homologous end joining protein LigD
VVAKRVADPFPKQIEPQLTRLVQQPPAGNDWLHEIKHDGYRMMTYLDQGQVRLVTRGGHNWAHRFPDIANEIASLDARQAVLDGELCALDANGRTSFHKLQSARYLRRAAVLSFCFCSTYCT